MLPYGLAGRGIAFSVLGVPGKAGRHHLKLNAVRLQQVALAVRPLALDKLYHRRFFTVADRARDGAEGGGGFALAVAGKNDNDAALILGGRDARFDFLFHALLALLVTFIAHSAIPGLRPGWASKLMPVFRRLSSPISHR